MRKFQFLAKFVIDNFKNIAYNQTERWHCDHENANDSSGDSDMQFTTTTVQPHQIPTPYELGFEDAQNGELFVPEQYYASHEQKRRYAEGFNAARPNPYAAAFLGHKNFVPAEVA